MTYSYSSISKFLSCPQAFYRQYILKEVKYEQSEAAKWGSDCHDFIDCAVKGTKEFSPRFEFLRPIVEKLKTVDGEVKTEYELSFKQGWVSTDWWSKEAILKGKADCTIFHPSEPRIHIKDWKFAKYKPESYTLEMDLFALLHFKKHPDIERIDTGLVWLKEPAPETKKTYLRSQVIGLEDDIMGKIARIEEAIKTEEFQMKPSGLCHGYCSCKLCPMWKPLKKKF
jgi:hypothetical protein